MPRHFACPTYVSDGPSLPTATDTVPLSCKEIGGTVANQTRG